MPEARAEPVAEIFGEQLRLAVDDPDRAFGAGRDAQAAAVAFFLVDGDDFTDHFSLLK